MPSRDDLGIVRPVTWWLSRLLRGEIDMKEAPVSVQSWSRFFVFQGAREIVLMDDIEERRLALSKIPPRIAPYVQAEVKRLWPMRAELATP